MDVEGVPGWDAVGAATPELGGAADILCGVITVVARTPLAM